MTNNNNPRPLTVLMALATLFMLPLTALSMDLNQKVNFNIPAQDLSAALIEFSKQARLQVIVSDDLTGKTTQGVSGQKPIKQALSQLLEPAGLHYEIAGKTSIAVGKTIKSTDSQTQAGGADSANGMIRVAQEEEKSAYSSSAQASSSSRSSGASSQDDADEVEEVVVTAQRREERLQQVPISISVLDGQLLDTSSFEGVSEALTSVPGVAITETYLGGGTNIVIRGVGASFPLFTGPSAVAYYLDSVPFGLVKSAIGPDANAYDLERVEVLRGPQGTLYGSSALNGVVRVLTHDADLSAFDVKGRVSASSTEHGGANYRGDLTVNAPIVQDKLAMRATVGHQDNEGWIDQLNRRDANQTETRTYRVKLDGRPTERLSVGLSAWVSRSDSGAPDLGVTWDRSNSSLEQPVDTDFDAYGCKLGYDSPLFSLSSVTSYLEYTNEGTLALDVPGFGVPGSTYFSQIESEIISQEINLNSVHAGPWRWSVGAMYRHGTEDLFQRFTVLPVPDIQYDNTSKSYAAYGQLTRLLLDDRLEFSAGLRYFRDTISQEGSNAPNTPLILTESKADATTPRVVLNYHPNRNSTLYASYSEGFRSGFPQTPAVLAAIPAFPSVEPDRLTNYELGIKQGFLGGAVSIDASVYHINWKDIQLLLAIPINGTPYPGVVNGAEASGNGADLSITFRPVRGVSFSPYISWNDLNMAEDVFSGAVVLYREGERPSSSPELSAGFSADFSFDIGGLPLHFSASGNYVSSQAYRSLDGPNLLVQEGDDIFTARASIAVDFSNQWTATVFGSNLTRERGIASIMFPGVIPDWSARVRPMTVGLQLEYRTR